MNKQHILALLGIVACLMGLFPPIHTYHPPVLLEDRGLAWQMRGGAPDLVVADSGGYRDRRFAFLLSLGDNDKIRFNQLAVELIVLAIAGFGVLAWMPRPSRAFLIFAGLAFLTGCGKSQTTSSDVALHSNSGASSTLTSAKWIRHTVESGADLKSIAWSGKEYVAVGSRGAIFRSEDLHTWKRTAPQTEMYFTTVAWLGSKFLVGGYNGTILTSSNGTTWSSASPKTKGIINRFAFSGSKFVAVFSGGGFLLSADDNNWILASHTPKSHPAAVAWSGKQFVAVGIWEAQSGDRSFRTASFNGAIMTSPDGTRWDIKSDTSPLFDVVWTGTHFAGVSGDGFLLLSSDGTAWIRNKLPVEAGASVAWTGSEFVVVGSMGSSGVVLVSNDGVNWNECRVGAALKHDAKAVWTGSKLLLVSGDSIIESVQ